MWKWQWVSIAPDSGNIFSNTNESIYNPVIVYYNKNVGGVDLLSKVMILYCSQHRGVKSCRKIGVISWDVYTILLLYGWN